MSANDDRISDGGATLDRSAKPFGLPRWVAAILPLVLLGIVLGVFVFTTPLANFQSGEPLPDVSVTHTTLPHDERIVLHVTNNGPESVTLSQVLVNDAYWDFRLMQGDQDVSTLGPRESGRVIIPYHWTTGWDFEVALLLNDGTTIHHTVEAPAESPGFNTDILWTLAVVGIFVGVIPVALGMLWFPFLQTMSDRWLHAILAFSVGILGFLAFDAGFEALEVAEQAPGWLEGELLVVSGVLGALLVVQAVSAWRTGRVERGDSRAQSGLWIAYLVALGIGLHNLAEGLAIGSSFAIGRVSLGAFLVIGFMLHNVTEGPAVVAPLARDERPSWPHFVGLGVLAGAPVILGGWIGGFSYSPTLGAFFLAIGVGAILQVVWEITGMIRRQSGRVGTAPNLLAFAAGLGIMYATDLLVAL